MQNGTSYGFKKTLFLSEHTPAYLLCQNLIWKYWKQPSTSLAMTSQLVILFICEKSLLYGFLQHKKW